MGIKKKIFLLLVTVSTVILCFSYTFIYRLFHKALTDSLISQQRTEIQLNARIINNFTNFARQSAMMLVGDPYLGQNLSTYTNNSLTDLQTRESIRNQVSHYVNAQAPDSYPCRSTLFLNRESVPISLSFEARTLDSVAYHQSSNVFSNQLVSQEDWYRSALFSPRNFYAFVNESTDEFCVAQKFQSAYFTGTFHPDGQGVLVTSVEMDHMAQVFNFPSVTANSGFALLNHKGELLYSSQKALPFAAASSGSLPNGIRESDVTLNGRKYLMNYEPINYQMSLIFLTPYSDITRAIMAVMKIYILFAVGIMIFMILACYLLSCRITNPIIHMAQTIGKIEDTRLFNPHSFDSIRDKELAMLCGSFNHLVLKINGLFSDIQIQNEKEKKAELKALQAQINPHFIFNAMDVVNWIALSRDNDDIAAIVSSIANLMRYSITEADSLVDIRLEIDNIREFISIYQLRHDSWINLEVGELPEGEAILIPKFTIQPLVENSIRHGMIDEETPIEIRISAARAGQTAIIEVTDNGKGCDPRLLNDYLAHRTEELEVSNGFGIRNVDQRIKLNFHGNSGLSYYTESHGHLTARLTLEVK